MQTINALTSHFIASARASGVSQQGDSNEVRDSVDWRTLPRIPSSGAELAAAVNQEPGFLAEIPQAPAPPVAVPEAEEAPKPTDWKEVAGKLALAGTFVTVGAVAIFGPVMSAHAQDIQVRNQTPVRVDTVDQVVQNFNAEHQLYVVGNPSLNGQALTAQDYQRFGSVLANHPNAYIVIVNGSTNLSGDDVALSRGIGNSAAFQSVVNERTGEREGVVIMIYTNVNDPGFDGDRAIFMRSEALPDRLGVGEAAFADEQGNPGPLMNMFIRAFRDEGKDMAGSVEVVFNHINSTIDQHVTQTVGTAEADVTAAETALTGVQSRVSEFQRTYGTGGQLGSPDVAGWQSQLSQARQALANHDFATASRISQALVSTIRTYEQAIASYAQAPAIAEQVQTQLNQVNSQLGSLENNGAAQEARQHHEAATRAMEQYQTSYQARNADFNTHLETARQEAAAAASAVQSSQSESAFKNNAVKYGTGAVVVAAL
ncbi:MAG: hypothetical protein AB1758_09485, partial [Candidatus Eremiobacterota bacterium]